VFVQRITSSVRSGINIAVLEGIEQGTGVPEMARNIQSVVGLNDKQAATLLKRVNRLKAQGLSDAEVAREKVALRKRALKQRARNIARTEMVAARNAGTQQAWNLAVNEGKLDPDMKKIWIMADGCPICTALAGLEPVPLGQPFDSPDVGFIDHPPAHPSCRCSIGLVE